MKTVPKKVKTSRVAHAAGALNGTQPSRAFITPHVTDTTRPVTLCLDVFYFLSAFCPFMSCLTAFTAPSKKMCLPLIQQWNTKRDGVIIIIRKMLLIVMFLRIASKSPQSQRDGSQIDKIIHYSHCSTILSEVHIWNTSHGW